MLSLLGSLIGFAGSAVPSIMGHFEKKENNKLQLEQMRLAGELKKDGVDLDLKVYEAKGADEEHKRLIEHDISMKDDGGIIGGLRKSVRPVITYMFFILFAAVEGITVYALLSSGADATTIKDAVWTDETQAIFAAIISFWFGSRALSKNSKG